MNFSQRLDQAIVANNSLLCVGLDPQPARMPIADLTAFNREIVAATADLVCAFKLQMAFYEALGTSGLRSLEATVTAIRDLAPNVMILGDGKRGDIGSTATAYAKAMFETWDFDGATVNVYQGRDSIEPFLRYEGRGVFVVCRTTNPSSSWLQDLEIEADGQTMSVYRYLAKSVEAWSEGRGNVGLVAGATAPDQLAEIRQAHPELPLLIPGIGAQGGEIDRVTPLGVNADGRGAVLSSSRQILYASDDPSNFGAAARQAAETTRRQIQDALQND